MPVNYDIPAITATDIHALLSPPIGFKIQAFTIPKSHAVVLVLPW